LDELRNSYLQTFYKTKKPNQALLLNISKKQEENTSLCEFKKKLVESINMIIHNEIRLIDELVNERKHDNFENRKDSFYNINSADNTNYTNLTNFSNTTLDNLNLIATPSNKSTLIIIESKLILILENELNDITTSKIGGNTYTPSKSEKSKKHFKEISVDNNFTISNKDKVINSVQGNIYILYYNIFLRI